MSKPRVVIIGAGVAGLCTATQLAAYGLAVEVYEASDRVGGRVQTDYVDGFQLDHGFQVLQTGYPLVKEMLELSSLNLSAFDPGALIQTENGRYCMVDPWRAPRKLWSTLFNPIGTFADRWRLARLRSQSLSQSTLHSTINDCSTHELLQRRFQFSTDFVHRFLRPWISGMFFDEELETSAEFFQFIFRSLATAPASLPAAGISQIPLQLAAKMPDNCIQLNSKVQEIDGNKVVMQDGRVIHADHVVVATELNAAKSLLWRNSEVFSCMLSRSVDSLTFYFAAETPPTDLGRSLLVNGELRGGFTAGPINNVTVPSNVAATYAPNGQSLICVSVRPSYAQACTKISEILSDLRKQATRWFGNQVESWKLIKYYNIPSAVPRVLAGQWNMAGNACKISQSLLVCGDYSSSPSLQGAMESGLRAARHILQQYSTNQEAIEIGGGCYATPAVD
ncbi:MAG: NAD(P)/FAD-dependent oxidoreductase [Pirellulales bacterium]